ncbi:MAG: sulfite exporter TauE/SafE family protein [Xanthomonadaceae bacterium]|nr:sulfite exporter TauE/SafE family protein [Xanthomonadaceae bacterium]
MDASIASWLIVGIVALAASLLTFFSGFGLGTLLLPAFALFMPLPLAVAATAVVHGANGVFKVALTHRHIERRTLLRFALPAMIAAFVGAWLLSRLGAWPALYAYSAFGRRFEILPLKLAIGGLLLFFALVELVPKLRDMEFDARWIPLGGALSGFFGGLAGMQGALRSAFLVRAGLDKHAYVATGAAIAVLIDVSRLSQYSTALVRDIARLDTTMLLVATVSAFVGAYAGNKLLKKTTMAGVQRLVAALLFAFAIGTIAGVL